MRIVEGHLVNFDHDAMAHFARCSATSIADQTYLTDINTLIAGLKTAGIWDLIDDICVLAPTEDDTLLGLKGLQDSSKYGSPVWNAGQGFESTATATIDTGIANDGVFQFSIESHYFVYVSELLASAEIAISGSLSPSYYIVSNDASDEAGFNADVVASDRTGFTIVSTTDLSDPIWTSSGNHNGVNLAGAAGSDVPTPSDLITSGMPVGARVSPSVMVNFGGIVGAWGLGYNLSSAQMTNYRNLIEAYMVARGASQL